ncbi:TetR family transcriptional regulator [Bradyrhizobium tunisiense]
MLRAAVALIGKHGTAGASLADIGVEAGYSRRPPVQRSRAKLS